MPVVNSLLSQKVFNELFEDHYHNGPFRPTYNQGNHTILMECINVGAKIITAIRKDMIGLPGGMLGEVQE